MKTKIAIIISAVCIALGIMGGVYFGYLSSLDLVRDLSKIEVSDEKEELFRSDVEVDAIELDSGLYGGRIEIQRTDGDEVVIEGTSEYTVGVDTFMDGTKLHVGLTADSYHMNPMDMFEDGFDLKESYKELLESLVNNNRNYTFDIVIKVPNAVKLKSDTRSYTVIGDKDVIKDELIINNTRDLFLPEGMTLNKLYLNKEIYGHVSLNLNKFFGIKDVEIIGSDIYLKSDLAVEEYQIALDEGKLPENMKITGHSITVRSYGPIATNTTLIARQYVEMKSNFAPYNIDGSVKLYIDMSQEELDSMYINHSETFVPLDEKNSFEGKISDGALGEYTLKVVSQEQGALIERSIESLALDIQ